MAYNSSLRMGAVVSDVLVRPITKLLYELGRSRKGFYRLLVGFLTGVAIYLFVQWPKEDFYVFSLSASLLLFALGFAIYDYLEPERIRNRNFLRDQIGTVTPEQEDNLSKVLEAVSQSVVSAIPPPTNLSSKDQANYADTLAQALSSQLKDALGSLQLDAQRRQLAQQVALIRSRLEVEIEAQGKRGRVNLTIGALFAFFGIGALGYFALWYEYKDVTELGIRFFPRITFVVLVEVFSYFFLNLYRHSIFEIKYFQNEMTNMDSRTLALQGCLLTGDSKMASKICELLAKTERNFVLKKGETSLQEKEIEIHTKNERSFVQNLKEVVQVLGLKQA